MSKIKNFDEFILESIKNNIDKLTDFIETFLKKTKPSTIDNGLATYDINSQIFIRGKFVTILSIVEDSNMPGHFFINLSKPTDSSQDQMNKIHRTIKLDWDKNEGDKDEHKFILQSLYNYFTHK